MGPAPLAGIVDGIAGSVAKLVVSEVLKGLNHEVNQGASWLLGQIGHALMTTGPELGAPWFSRNYQGMVDVAAALLLPLLLGAVVQALINQSVGQLVRSVLLLTPVAIVLTGAAVELVQLGSSAVDSMSAQIASGTAADLSLLMKDIDLTGSTSIAPVFVVFAVLVILTFGAFILWLELVVRAAAIEVTVLFLPLVLAGLVWPATARLSRRLAETVAALVLSKLVMVGVISLASDAIVQPGTQAGMSSLLQGTAMLFLATLSPFAVLRLLPMIEAGAVGHLEGAGRRLASTVSRPVSRTGSMVLASARGGGYAYPDMLSGGEGGSSATDPGSGESEYPGGVGKLQAREGRDRPPTGPLGGAQGGGGPGDDDPADGGGPVGRGGPPGGGPVEGRSVGGGNLGPSEGGGASGSDTAGLAARLGGGSLSPAGAGSSRDAGAAITNSPFRIPGLGVAGPGTPTSGEADDGITG